MNEGLSVLRRGAFSDVTGNCGPASSCGEQGICGWKEGPLCVVVNCPTTLEICGSRLATPDFMTDV